MDRKELDVRGLKCPLPIVLTRRALDRMETGKVLRVMASEGLKEFQAFAAQTGHQLQSAATENGEIEVLLWRTENISPAVCGK